MGPYCKLIVLMPQIAESVEVEYVPERAEVEDFLLEEFKSVFQKFSFSDSIAAAEVKMKGVKLCGLNDKSLFFDFFLNFLNLLIAG